MNWMMRFGKTRSGNALTSPVCGQAVREADAMIKTLHETTKVLRAVVGASASSKGEDE